MPAGTWTQPLPFPVHKEAVCPEPASTSPCGRFCLPSGRFPPPPCPRVVDSFRDGKPPPPPHFPGVSLFSQSFGFALLACSHYHWQLSFLQAEQVLLEQLDEDGGCRRKCLRALRQMKEDVWCPGRRPVITSHHLQVSGHTPGVGASSLGAPRAGQSHSQGALVSRLAIPCTVAW